jgi:hypothetical protein
MNAPPSIILVHGGLLDASSWSSVIERLLAHGYNVTAPQFDEQGYAWNSEDGFINHFASDVDPVTAKVLFAVQQPIPIALFGQGADVMGVPAWKFLPCWYTVTTEDQAIPPDAQRQFAQRMRATTVEVKSNHLAPVTHPDDTAQLIETAAQTAPVAA